MSQNLIFLIVVVLCFVAFANQMLPDVHAVITVTNARLVDAFGNSLDEISIDQQIQITGDVSNSGISPVHYYFVVEIMNEADESVFGPEWISAIIDPGQALSNAISWIPVQDGTYAAIVTVYDTYPFTEPLDSSTSIFTVGDPIIIPEPEVQNNQCGPNQSVIDGICQDNLPSKDNSISNDVYILLGVAVIAIPAGIFGLKHLGTRSNNPYKQQSQNNQTETNNDLVYWLELEYGLIEDDKKTKGTGN